MQQTARAGADVRVEIEAVAGLIQAASATGDFEVVQATAEAARSRAAFVLSDNAVEIVGKGYTAPTPTDPIGEVLFEVEIDVPWHGSFVLAQDFDRGIEYIPPPPPPPPSGFNVPLGDIVEAGDGSWTPGAVPLTDDTFVSEAVDRLNEILGLLVPAQPPAFPAGVLSVANGAGSSPLLASGVTANVPGSGWSAGSSVTRITAAGVSSFSFSDVGPGNAGVVSLLVNRAVVGSKELTGSGDNGNYGGLVISDQKPYPVETPGFWVSFDATVTNAAAPVGINSFQLTHSEADDTSEVYFVRDALTATPAITSPTVVEAVQGTLAYSSGVPHYGSGASLSVQASISNLAGETYYGGSDVFTVSGTNGILNNQSFGYAALGIATPLARQTTGAEAMSAVTVSLNGTGHNSGQVRGAGRNVNGAGATATLSSATVLTKVGSAGAKIDETSVTVSGLGSAPVNTNASRKGQASGDTPSAAPVAWVQSDAPAAHEATVVAGVLKHDQTDYSSGHLPVGPNLSAGRSGAQYVTFSFRRSAVSAFKINVTGSYAGCRIKLPGVSDNAGISPNAASGWWDATRAYDGAGVPGEAGDTLAGCAVGAVMSGGSGSFQITFGTQSSTNATDNEILVRFRLNAGQSITALSFTN